MGLHPLVQTINFTSLRSDQMIELNLSLFPGQEMGLTHLIITRTLGTNYNYLFLNQDEEREFQRYLLT